MPKRILAILIFAIAITFVVVALPMVPLGVTLHQPDGTSVVEWVWSRHSSFTDIADFLNRTLWPTFAAICLVLVARLGFRRTQNAAGKSTVIVYGLLIIASAHWMLAVQQSAASPHKELKPLWVLYDPAASGYFYEAAFDIKDTKDFVSSYEARMAEGDVLHVGTHPPGMFLLAKGCIEVCRNFPAIQNIAEALTPDSSAEAFRYVEQNARLRRSLTGHELAGLKLLSLVTFVMAVSTLVPLCLLANRMFAPTTAWMMCCLWPTIPAISIFFPKSDVIFPSLSLLLLLLATIGAQSVKKAMIVGVVAGVILLLTSCLSLAILPTVAAIGVFLTLQILRAPKKNGVTACTLMGTVTATVVVMMIAIQSFFDCNLATIFQQNLANHAGFYQQFQRTYRIWLLVNPVEFAFAVGLPLMGFALVTVARLLNKQQWSTAPSCKSTAATQAEPHNSMNQSVMAALAITIVLLWISGKNNGEAARLWCFMTPWILLLSGSTLQHLLESLTAKQTGKAFTWLLITQLILCLMTVSRVSGFSF